MRNNVDNTYPSTMRFVLEYYKTQKMSDSLVIFCAFLFDSVPNLFKTKEMYKRVASEDFFPYRYKTQHMCDEAVGSYLARLKITLDWFVESELLEKIRDALLTNTDILFFGKDFNKVTFVNEMTICF